MTDSIAQRAITVVMTRLAAINGSSPYNLNPNGRIYQGLPTVEIGDLPCIVVHAPAESSEATNGDAVAGQSNQMKTRLDISVEGFVPATSANFGSQVEKMKADLKRALLRSDATALRDASGIIGPLIYIGAEVLERDDGHAWAAVRVNCQAIYIETFGDPTASR